ncbi:MAG TPA: glycosyltransferase [Gemmataceae bacterium]|nr:glycosyltransferase [Gemmataceae bacterium]
MIGTAPCETATPHGEYKGFRLFALDDRFYAVPPHLVRIDPNDVERAFYHPAALAASTVEAIESLIDTFDPTPFVCEPVGEYEGHDLVRHGEHVYGVPRHLGPIDLNLEKDRTRNGVVRGETREEVIARICAERSAFAVEFVGWMPVFARFGNCGTHPLFGHTQAPPPGYKFLRTRPDGVGDPQADDFRRPRRGWLARLLGGVAAVFVSLAMFARSCREFGLVRCLANVFAALRLFVRLVRKTGRVRPALRFVHSRHFQSQVVAPRADLVFVTSVPYTYGQNPWVIEIEDSNTLFYPFIANGKTAGVDVARSPYFAMVKAMLEDDACRGILTHMRSTAETLPTLFGSEVIARKVSYVPLGVRPPKRWQTQDGGETINLLFTNSWHQNAEGFYLRGGLDVLEAFWILHERYPQLRLTIRSSIPKLHDRHYRMLEQSWVRVINRFTPARRMDELFRESHVYLLPAARIHIVSLLQAMSYGQAVVVSDGWGFDEFVTDGANGLVVRGRAGKVSWMDREAGLLREDYRPMFGPNPAVVEGLVEAVSRLVEDGSLRRRLGRAARRDIETKHTFPQWNAALKAALDRARQ